MKKVTLSWATATNPGIVRDRNEDNVSPTAPGVTEDDLVIMVADGMGGHVAGEVASQVAVEAAETADGGPVDRVQAANEAVMRESMARPDRAGMGTTLTLAEFDTQNSHVEVAHVGDSRAYLLTQGELQQLTDDHSLVNELLSSGQITDEEAVNHPRKNVITRALGTDWRVAIDNLETDIEVGDRYLLCTDGLTNMVSDDDIADILATIEGAQPAAWALVERANEAGGEDNISVAVIDVLQ
jgi:protein phosphatase